MSRRDNNRVDNLWYGASPLSWLLVPFSWLYLLLISLRRKCYTSGLFRSRRMSAPVVVVGNINVGGTGKTPMTIWLAGELIARGFTPGIVTRGYRGNVGPQPLLVAASSDSAIVGDEAILLARRCNCPVVVHPDRADAAQKAIALGADIIIADDGLQHLQLVRDFEIALVDGVRQFGNGHLLPAGPLREPVSRLLDVDEILVQGVATQVDDDIIRGVGTSLRYFRLLATEARRVDESLTRPLDDFSEQTVHAVAGIGNPERFFRMLESFGMHVVRHPLPDHAKISRNDLQFDDAFDVVITEKDAVKCQALDAGHCWYVPADVSIDESDRVALLEKLLHKIENRVAS